MLFYLGFGFYFSHTLPKRYEIIIEVFEKILKNEFNNLITLVWRLNRLIAFHYVPMTSDVLLVKVFFGSFRSKIRSNEID